MSTTIKRFVKSKDLPTILQELTPLYIIYNGELFLIYPDKGYEICGFDFQCIALNGEIIKKHWFDIEKIKSYCGCKGENLFEYFVI
jgi:hypothetical protein